MRSIIRTVWDMNVDVCVDEKREAVISFVDSPYLRVSKKQAYTCERITKERRHRAKSHKNIIVPILYIYV